MTIHRPETTTARKAAMFSKTRLAPLNRSCPVGLDVPVEPESRIGSTQQSGAMGTSRPTKTDGSWRGPSSRLEGWACRLGRVSIWATVILSAGLCLTSGAGAQEPNTLTPSEKTTGWKLLFDGQTTRGWRSFKKSTFPSRGWEVKDGWLVKVGGVRGGDIITDESFSDFELEWDWKIAPRGNNGVKYFITEERGGAVGHEYQMMDDPGKTGKGSTGSFYDVLPPLPDKPLKPAGEINHSRIVVRGNHVEHWLNGVKILQYELGSPEVLAAVERSKFRNVKGFGTKIRGHILLTDHGDACSFRNIKIRPLEP